MRRYLLLLVTFFWNISLVFGGHTAALSHSRKVCSTAATAGTARCHAIVLTDSDGVEPMTSHTPQGYSPAAFKAAYGSRGAAATKAGIVVAYDAPTVASDLAVFSKTFGLPVLPTCTSAAQLGCFEKLDQRGGTSYPATNSSWAVEASLDVESVHGMCSSCRISLYEANSPSLTNLSTAAATAISNGAKVVSNSYGGPEYTGETAYDSRYRKAGVIVLVSSGDNGYGTNYPAANNNIVAVGGTTLKMSGSKVLSETAWEGAGSGCSAYENKPAWQHDKKCQMRSIADIAADADPASGAAIYDSYASGGRSGWFTVGGTSLAAPLVAGMVAASQATNLPAQLYTGSTGVIRDIISGSNGSCGSYLCRAATGYDGPTGLGVL
ncbi:MAG TPA: S8 family serine peptidase [Candidatus Saccharimonadales bacterium]|jgi:subtilase family serine protease|nr:S8 family serine peptidase [Candidatus Saccharimonadales bacterium]